MNGWQTAWQGAPAPGRARHAVSFSISLSSASRLA